jgi:hypothetical protein
MKIVRSKRPLPRNFRSHPHGQDIVAEKDLRIGTSRLRCKLLLFDTRKGLRRFWKRAVSKADLGPQCPGAVNDLRYTKYEVDRKGNQSNHRIEVDPRYFAVIGIVKNEHSALIVTHEAVHAGFAYYRRVRRTPWDRHIKRSEEEGVAYPAGEIGQGINDLMWKVKRQK